MPHPPLSDITGLVLAGGRGSRMGGLDKGLQGLRGRPLAWHALQRLEGQVGALLINANRHLAEYAQFGLPVVPDAMPDFPGPLAGMLAGLSVCETPLLLTVPCDTPHFPQDLAQRLSQALHAEQAEVAMAASLQADEAGLPRIQHQPVFCLMRRSVLPSLAQAAQHQRGVARWAQSHRHVTVLFDAPEAFASANTLEALQRLA